MNYSTAVFLINKQVRAVLATYEADDRASKTMFKTLDPTIGVGDFIIVPTDTRHRMTVCKVTDVDATVDFDSSTPVAWVVGKIDRRMYEETIKQEENAIEAIKSAEYRRRRESLRDSLMADAEALKALPLYANGSK